MQSREVSSLGIPYPYVNVAYYYYHEYACIIMHAFYVGPKAGFGGGGGEKEGVNDERTVHDMVQAVHSTV